jgi:hypothetical protein
MEFPLTVPTSSGALASLATVRSAPWVSINAIRVLAMDAVEQANSGHPGTPMALAPVAYLLWTGTSPQSGQSGLGRPRTGSCCPAATRPCCCTRCCT